MEIRTSQKSGKKNQFNLKGFQGIMKSSENGLNMYLNFQKFDVLWKYVRCTMLIYAIVLVLVFHEFNKFL